jgi:CRP/FNR family cyclic AMP-dependent transcriptional regulator
MPDSPARARELLAQIELFSGLAEAELEHLATSLRRRRFAKGQILFFRGDPGQTLYIIESGQVKIVLSSSEGREFSLALLGPMDFFGDLALLDGEPRSADAVAQDTCHLLLLEREDFLRFLEAHPQAAAKLLSVLSRRLRQNAEIVQDAAFLDIAARLARTLLRLTSGDDAGSGAPLPTKIRMTQTELASMIGATRESVNKWLRFYQRRGWIQYERGTITISRPDALRQRLA